MASTDEAEAATANADTAWGDSLRQVMREVIAKLPDNATLGELVDAVSKNSQMARVLEIFSVKELIELARQRPRPARNGNGKRQSRGEVTYDEDGNPVMALGAEEGPTVIRRRADAPDGDFRVLKTLSDQGPQREGELATKASLSSDQMRLIIRGLRSRGLIHIEGSAAKRRIKITRAGNSHLRRAERELAAAK